MGWTLRWALSDLNPWLGWLHPTAELVKEQRLDMGKDNVALKLEKVASAAISASLEYYRAMRDAASEGAFFQTYGNVFSLYVADKQEADEKAAERIVEPRELPFIQEALASIAEGDYPEALARVACLLARKGEPLLLSRLQMRQELMADYRELLPAMPADQWRRVRGEQEIIVRYEPERALATLPKLLAHHADREKLVTLVRRLLADERVQRAKPSTEQLAMVEHIGETLALDAAASRRSVRRKGNGSLHTDELMGAVVNRETGLRAARRISHCFVMDVPSYAETLIVTDAAVNIAPTMEVRGHFKS